MDTAIAYFLLCQYGEQKFIGINNAPVVFWSELPEGRDTDELEEEGYILIDLGGSKFDHHNLGPDNKSFSASHLIAQYLGIEDRPEIQKLLEFARRDDLEGKGTISSDSIDRAFGFSGLLMSLNKNLSGNPKRILEIVLPFLQSHYLEEYRRHEILPEEYAQLLRDGRIKEFKATHFSNQLKVIYIESDNAAMAGYLRSRAVGADLVIQRSASGHVNFVSNQQSKLRIHKLAREVKLLEASKQDLLLLVDSMEELEKPGRTEGLPHWFYDARAITLQNGGVNPGDIPPTKLNYAEIEHAVKIGLNIAREENNFKSWGNKKPRGRGRGYEVY